MRLILNELSLCSNCKTIEDGQRLFQEFIENYTQMERLAIEKGIVLFSAFQNFMLTKDYSIHNWITDKRIEKRLKDKFRSLVNKSSYINEDDFWYSQFIVDGFTQEINAFGCLVAYEREDFVISLRTNRLWDKDQIDGLYFSVMDEFQSEDPLQVTVPNFSQESHIQGLKQIELEESFSLIASGQDLWEKKDVLYPHLIFCESVRDQLLEDTEKIHIEQIMKRLFKMESYFSTYDGIFDSKKLGLGARQESESVMKSEKYRQQRVFRTPYEDERPFYWHIDFAGKYPGRIHFLPDDTRKNCLIGYIGKHLPTPTYKTI